MVIIDVLQNSPEWYAAKCGIPSSSEFDKLVILSGKPSKQREKYLYRLAGERLLGHSEESYQNAAMLRGKEVEAEARQYYEFITGQEVKQVGFCLADGYGASPDGLIGDDGLLEIKCPILSTHIYYLIKNELPSDYIQQVEGQLLVTGRKWVDFLSYYPGLDPLLIRVERDEDFIKTLKIELKIFCQELDELTEKLRG
ncbi:MAG: lambda exonuclease family protein [Candidatus Omnitrophota bacterium]